MKIRSKITLSIIGFLVIAVFGVAAFAYSMFGKVKRVAIPQNDGDLGISENANEKASKKGVLNIALFGLDNGKSDGDVRSDSIIVVSIDRDKERIKATSIMRDGYVSIPGYGEDKINAAYHLGGPGLAVRTINTNFDLDVRNYVTVDFSGLEKLVDKVGGVEVKINSAEAEIINNSTKSLKKSGVKIATVKAGVQNLNGVQALAYSRIRSVGKYDFQRTSRQRTVLNEIFKKVKAQGREKLPGTISSILPFVVTNLTNSEIIELSQTILKYNADGIEQFRIPFDDSYKSDTIDGIYVLKFDMEQNKEKLHEFIYGSEGD